MAENTKSEQELEQEVEQQAKGQTTAVPVEQAEESKTEALESRTNKIAMG